MHQKYLKMRRISAKLSQFALKNEHSSILKLINKLGLNTKNSEGLTQLHIAIMNHDLKTAHFLIDCGANINDLHSSNPNPFLLMTKSSELS